MFLIADAPMYQRKQQKGVTPTQGEGYVGQAQLEEPGKTQRLTQGICLWALKP